MPEGLNINKNEGQTKNESVDLKDELLRLMMTRADKLASSFKFNDSDYDANPLEDDADTIRATEEYHLLDKEIQELLEKHPELEVEEDKIDKFLSANPYTRRHNELINSYKKLNG